MVISLFLNSCIKEKNPLIGKWIEKDNFTNPMIYEISEDYYVIINSGVVERKFYKIKKDTFIYDNYFQIEKLRFKTNGSLLSFYSSETDSQLSSFEKFSNNNFIDFFNSKKNTSINLPEIHAKNLKWGTTKNSIVCEYDGNGELIVFRNGELHLIDSLSFLKLLPNPDDYWTRNNNNLIFCDKNVKLKDFNIVKNELMRGHLTRITYVTQNNNKHLFGIRTGLPFKDNHLPDSLISKYPQPPPLPIFDLDCFTSRNILCLVKLDGIELNNKKRSWDNLHVLIKEKIKTVRGLVIHVNFDENLKYENYLLKLKKIRNIYYSIRNEYSQEKYNEPNYEDLENEAIRKVRRKFPMSIREIDKEEYNEIKKYAL